MLTNVNAAKCAGIDAVNVTVEINIDRGIGIHLCGLADVAVKESLLRVTTALQSLGYRVPGKKIVINLAPADLHKNGSGYDLAIALGIIAASEQKALPGIQKYIIMGELGLDGSVRDIPGALPYAELAGAIGLEGIIVPLNSGLEAVAFNDVKVYGVRSLNDAIRILEEVESADDLLVQNSREYRIVQRERQRIVKTECIDFADIIGQEGAKRGAEIACAGNHNLIFIGAPGAGKSSIAKAMAGILPPLTRKEALVTSKIQSISGKRLLSCGLVSERPFRSPHYSASVAAMVGGGGGDSIFPGEVSLAMNGILFLDEFGQMPKSVIEALRSPIEDRKVTISRLKQKVEYPASFMLVAASNPCPCGYWGEGDRCCCSPTQRMSYLSKLSGPILDRLDLHVWMHTVPPEMISSRGKAEPSAAVAERVLKARIRQKHRFATEEICTNAEMTNKLIEKYCPLSMECMETMDNIMTRQELSMRAYFRIIKVARTIADLDGSDDIEPKHLVEAAGFRFLDRQNKMGY